jgi:3-oxoacyl-[acyl-carrier protein] reductase
MIMEEDTRRVALVTGGGKGIGAAIALELGKTFTVIINYCSSKDNAEDVAAHIRNTGGTAQVIQADVSNEEDVIAMFRTIKNTYGTLDLLVNNAGVTSDGFLMTMSLESWNKVIQTDLTSVFLCTREAIKIMYSSKTKGKIINISSVSGVVGLEGQANYSAAKGGVISFTKSVAKEVAKYGITANAIAPGFIETEMIKKVPKSTVNQIVSSIPIQRIGTVDDIARFAGYLASDDATYFTGKVFTIDGGMVI